MYETAVHEKKLRSSFSSYLSNKSKNKVIPVILTEHHAMKAYWGGGIAPLILDLYN
jgi:hypothetical protein